MASRKSININVSKYYVAVRNCINIFVLCSLKILRLCCPVSISANCVTAGNLYAGINPSSYLFHFLEGFSFRFEFLKSYSNIHQPLG